MSVIPAVHDRFMPSHDRSAQPRHLRAVESAHEDNLVTDDEFVRRQTDLFEPLLELVGGWDELWSLDAEPLPDESFAWSAVEPVDRPFVGEVLRLVDECCNALLDAEYRTIARRLVARIAANDPRALRRSPHAARCAAGLMWLVGMTSGPFRRRGRGSAGWIWAWFGVSNCADRGRTLYRAGDFAHDCDPRAHLHDPLAFDVAFLHSHRRAALISAREQRREVALTRRTVSIESSEGRAHMAVKARPTRAVTAMKALSDEQRAIVVVGFGDELDDADYLSLTIPDAHDLVHMLQHALDDPIPYLGAS
jgi:hypothetical protein